MLSLLYIINNIFNLSIGYGSSKEGKCPPLTGDEDCSFKLLHIESAPCSGSGLDFECLGDDKCCDDGCGGYECKPAIGLPPLPVIGKTRNYKVC